MDDNLSNKEFAGVNVGETRVSAADDGRLSPDHSPDQATDILWTLLSVRNWERLTIECGWPQAHYVETLKALARRILVVDQPPTRRANSEVV